MKRTQLQRLFLMIALVLLVLTGCKKDDKKADDPKPVKPDPVSVTDIDGNTYKTVRIGTQLWMAENLRVTRFNDGTPIPTTDPPDLNISGNTHAVYQWITMYDTTLLKDLGRVYSYGAGSHPMKNICPEGWRVPKQQDWLTLNQFLGGDQMLFKGHVLMEENSPYWEPKLLSIAQDPNNETGFTARGGGQRLEKGGEWYAFKKVGLFMMSDVNHGFAIDYASTNAFASATASSPHKHVRCIMD